jgi:rSAM/selenodomain-associated transferase 2
LTISVIIPTWNESQNIGGLVTFLRQHGGQLVREVIVVDGSSTDDTLLAAERAGAVTLRCAFRSRAAQMNLGAQKATGEILYFIHADVKLIPSFAFDIVNEIENGFHAGCYRYVFDSDHPLLKINGYCTRFDRIMCRGGDQTLFVTATVFKTLRGFNEYFTIMEDYDFLIRLRKKNRFKIIPKSIVVSARKYETNSWLRVQFANFVVFMMFFMGKHPDAMRAVYKRLLKYR